MRTLVLSDVNEPTSCTTWTTRIQYDDHHDPQTLFSVQAKTGDEIRCTSEACPGLAVAPKPWDQGVNPRYGDPYPRIMLILNLPLMDRKSDSLAQAHEVCKGS